MGRERARAPVHLLRPDQRGARRERVDLHQFQVAVVRLGHQRERLSDRRHRLHRAADRRGVAVAQHRRDRRNPGALARRARRLRQPGRRRVQRRDAAGQQHLPRRRQLLLPDSEPHRPQHHRRAGQQAALSPRRVQGHDPAAGRPGDEGQALVLRVLPIPEGRRFAARHRSGLSGALVGQAVLLEGQLPAEREKPLSGSDARRLLPHPGTRHRQHRAQHARRGKRAQPVAGRAVDLGDQLDHRAGSALLGLLRRGSRRPAQRRSARGAAIQRPRHRPDHRRHLLVVRREERQDRVLGQGHQVRRQVPGREPRLQARGAVQQRPG